MMITSEYLVRLEGIEKLIRWTSGVAAVALLTVVYLGLWRGARRPKGRGVGQTTFLRGPFSFYLVASAVFFGLVYLLWRPLRLPLSTRARAAALISGSLLFFPGLALMLWGRLALGNMYGVSTSLGAQLYADHKLITSGPYALVRHPMYLGAQLAGLGSLLIYRTWASLFVALTFLALVLRARREEQALAAEFGEQWLEYRRCVPAWIPRFRKRHSPAG